MQKRTKHKNSTRRVKEKVLGTVLIIIGIISFILITGIISFIQYSIAITIFGNFLKAVSRGQINLGNYTMNQVYMIAARHITITTITIVLAWATVKAILMGIKMIKRKK